MTDTTVQSIAALDWFVTRLTQIKNHDWMAQALTTGCNPLVGYTCAASGATIELALTNLLSKLNNNFDFVPPPMPTRTDHTAHSLADLLGLNKPAPGVARITRRR